ncbi:hypothetical protein ACIBG8_52790 [Nonomuraea sp. NPDC050556]|uniref:hypothetical protein n=1 Tax=Nonomuraea sp. NPDC050556 TaxID=3364369 RepID=UPI00379B11FC
MRSAIIGGFVAILLAGSAAPAMAAVPLDDTLLTPQDLGSEYQLSEKPLRFAIGDGSVGDRKCDRAIKALRPLLKSKAAVFIEETEAPTSRLRQFSLSGKVAPWQAVGKAMVRDCAGVNTKKKNEKTRIVKLSVGKLGDWSYGIRYSQTIPSLNAKPLIVADVALIRVGDAVTLVVSDGVLSTFNPALSRRAARLAAEKLAAV